MHSEKCGRAGDGGTGAGGGRVQSGLMSQWGSSVGRGADYDPTQVRPSRPAPALSNLRACRLTLLSGGGGGGGGGGGADDLGELHKQGQLLPLRWGCDLASRWTHVEIKGIECSLRSCFRSETSFFPTVFLLPAHLCKNTSFLRDTTRKQKAEPATGESLPRSAEGIPATWRISPTG